MATTLPVVEATGGNGVFSATTLSMLPIFTWAKLVALGLLTASLLVGGLAKFRVLFGAVAAVMIFVPAVSAFLSPIHAWGAIRERIVEATGARNPFANPGEAAAAIGAAALLVIGGLWRIERRAAPATASEPGALTA